MKILITGITGFVGSGLVNYLSTQKGIEIVGHSRHNNIAKKKFNNYPIEFIETYSAKTIDELGIDCIIHLAGIAHDLSNKFKPEDYYKVNFEGTKTIFQEFIKSTAKKFIFLSSIKAAVDSSASPVDESVIPNPTSDYGKSKLMAENFISQQVLYNEKFAYIFRPCMIHGKGNKGNLNVLYKYVKSGLPYVFGAYSNQRSFLTSDNLNFITHQFLMNDFHSGIYHLADDSSFSTNQLISIISESLNKKPRIWNIPASFIDPLSKTGNFLRLPTERLKNKLTESLVVSTQKLKRVMQKPLPIAGKDGLMQTLDSFK